jgi:nucleoid-associated protein YgaU
MPRVHTVDYGDGMKFPIIAQANGIRDPNLIFPGQVLQIPDLEQPPPPPPPPPQPSPQPAPPPQPEPPPQPISFRLLRPADLLNLQCTAIGCRVTTDEGPPGGSMTTHTVVPGDTLWDLAQRFYGDPWLFPLIAAANHIPNPNLIFPGQVLVIPPRPAPPAPAAPVTHKVVPGDTLWDIAKRFYGNPFRYHEIAAANGIANPDLIFPDQVLVIPGLSGPAPVPTPSTGTRLVAVADGAHLIVRFGIQNVFEQATVTKPTRAKARAADDSRVVFELPKGTEMPFTVAGLLLALTTLGLRVPPLAVPPLKEGEQRPPEANVPLAAPKDDQTAIEAPYRLIVSPDATEGFTHAAEAASAPSDSNRIELWHSRLGVRKIVDGKFEGVDETATKHVRAVWTRDKDQPNPPDFTGSLEPAHRHAIVRQSADPEAKSTTTHQPIEPVPFDVERLYLSSLGAWLDWRVAWPRDTEYEAPALSAYRHLAPLGRDSYVRVEEPIYLYPFGHRGTYVQITERKIAVSADDEAAYLSQRHFIVLREHTRTYGELEIRRLPFTSVSIDPIVSPDLDNATHPATDVFIPVVKGAPYRWKVTGIDHAGREITMMTPLVAVPLTFHFKARDKWNALLQANGTIDVGGAEVAFAPPKIPGDTTVRTQFIDFTGDAGQVTSTPWMARAHVTIPALAAINKGGGPAPVEYPKTYVDNGLPDTDKAQLFLELVNENKLDFAGGSDRGGGFIEPSVAVNAISRIQGAVGDAGKTPGGIAEGKFNPDAFLGSALPKLFGLFDLKEILLKTDSLAQAPKLIAEQLDLIGSVAAEYTNLAKALEQARATLDADIPITETAGAKQRLQEVRTQVQQALDALAANPVQPLLDALGSGVPASAAGPAGQILGALNAVEMVRIGPFLPAYLRALIERPYRAVEAGLKTAQDATKLANALQSAVNGTTIRYEWNPPIKGWPDTTPVFIPEKPDGLAIAVEIRTSKDGQPQSDVTAQLRNFKLQLLPGEPLMSMKFSRIGFRVSTGGKPEVDVQFDKLEFLGPLGFIEKLRQVIPFDGFADPPYVDINTEGATAGFDLALPSVAVGVFTLENISLAADCRVPFLGEAVTVGFGFCTKESPFRLTVMAIGGGGWVGIRLAPKGLVMLEMGLEAGAALSVDFGVASGSVSVMVGVYLRLEDKKGQLTAYFRIRGEVEVLGIASASITLELSLTYDFPSGKLIGRATLRVEVEVLFFSASVEITCERKLAGSKGDPALVDIIPPAQGGQALWDQYFSSFAIGA